MRGVWMHGRMIAPSMGAASLTAQAQDDATAALVAELAKKRRVSKQDAVRLAIRAELERIAAAIPLRERIAAWRKEHPLPPPTGQTADGLLRRLVGQSLKGEDFTKTDITPAG